MMKKNQFSMWLIFSMTTFLILHLTALIVFFVAVLLHRLGLVSFSRQSPFDAYILLLLVSAIVGTIFSLIVGNRGFRPVREFSEALQEVAKGNFNVRLKRSNQIYELQELKNNFNRMVHELSTIETLQSDFVSNVSHEFKTPLAAIEGYATLLQDNQLSEEERNEYIRMIMDSSRQLSTLVGNILKLSKLENQDILLHRTTFRLDEQIREAVLMLEPKWGSKNIELDIELDKTMVTGEKDLLMQIWINLIDNAIKFSENAGRIEVRLTISGDTVKVIMKDYGRGIDASDMRRIFDKFYQSDRTRRGEGNGLGLALVKRILDLCNGSISVESQIDYGSTFEVILPIYPPIGDEQSS